MAFIGKSAVSPARFRLVAQQLVPTLNYPSSEIRRAARIGTIVVFSYSTKKGRLKRFHNCYTRFRNRRVAFSSGKSHPARAWIGHLNCGTALFRRPAYKKKWEMLMPLRSLSGSPVQVAIAAEPPAAVKPLPARPRSRSRNAPSRLPSSPASGPPPRSGGSLPAE